MAITCTEPGRPGTERRVACSRAGSRSSDRTSTERRNPMTTSAVQPRSAAAPSGDPCCCDGHHDSRCSIECLVEPRFFCGQLLTDDDLTTVVGWARQRLGLARHRHGWGVACGLDVVCDPEHPGRILVHPGYAVDRCGEDVVACDPLQYDLAAVCSPPPGDCTDVYQQQPTPERYPPVALSGSHVAEDAEPQLALAGGTCREPTVCEPSRTKQRLELRAEPAAPERDPV